jgi:hypothetical protein
MSIRNKNPNENCLEGMACPKCGEFGPLAIVATQAGMLCVSDDGTDFFKDGNVEWEDSARCKCLACDHTATVAEFRGEAPASFDQHQKMVLAAYREGEFTSLTPATLASSGNALLKFLLSELSTHAGCKNRKTALNRLDRAIRSLNELRAVFGGKPPQCT